MADPVVIQCSSACTVQVEFTTPLLSLTAEEGGLIGVAMVGVLAVAWGVRMVIKAMNAADNAVIEGS